MIKRLIKRYLESLIYFYRHLGYRVFVVFGLSFIIGVLDGLGLTMFLPLLQMVSDSSNVNPESLGKLSFLIDIFNGLGIELNLFSVLIIMAFFFITKGVIYYFSGIYKVNVQQGFITRLRIKNLFGLHNISYKYFVSSDIGRIQNTLTGEVERVAQAFRFYFRAFQNGIMILVYMGFAFGVDAQFAILVTIGGFVANLAYKNLYKHTKGSSRQLTSDTHTFQGLIIQNVSNYKYLKATGKLKAYGDKLLSYIKKIEKSNKRIGYLDSLLVSGREPILVVIVVTIIYIQTGILGSPLGPILISLIFFYRALTYLMQMQMDWNRFISVSGSVDNMTSFEREMRENKETVGGSELTGEIQSMELKNASFYYGTSKILDDIKLEIENKQTIGFVGESGSGKTTLVNILCGLLKVEEGTYKINDTPVNELKLFNFQSKIGYITQDSVIFNDTIFNNVTFWAEPTQNNVKRFWEVIRKASLQEFVKAMPQQEDEILGANGVTLSGGQKQRISIARELFKEIEILILDEATSALDSETEKSIQRNIDELKGDYTILIIAHRISTIKNADKIVVMKNGKITNSGSFFQLIENSDYFKKLVELQEI